MTDRPPVPQTFGPFRYPAFKAIWLANLISSLGATIQSVAAAWLMTELTDSHTLIAMVQASTTIPIMLLSVFAGAIADNFDRRRVMLAAQAGMLAVSALLALLAGLGALTPWLLLGLTLAVGTGTALNTPAWQASVRMQVGPNDLPQAIALNSVAFNLARSVGPALGGVLLTLSGAPLAFAINAASYVALIGVLAWWRPEAPSRRREPMLAAIGRGLAYCRQSSPIRRVLLRGLAFGFGAAGYQALIPALARDQLGSGELGFGLVLGAFGLGSIIAALWASPLRRQWGSEVAMVAATLGFALAQLVLAAASSLPLAVFATFAGGASWVLAMTSLNVAMQLRSPEAILGRCLSIHQAVTFGGMALGAMVWGILADLVGLTGAVRLAALWLILTLPLLHVFAPMPTREEGRVL